MHTPDFLRKKTRTWDLRHSSIQANLSCAQNHKFIIFHFYKMQHFKGSLISPQLLYLINTTPFILYKLLSSLLHIFYFLTTLTSVGLLMDPVTLGSQIPYFLSVSLQHESKKEFGSANCSPFLFKQIFTISCLRVFISLQIGCNWLTH